MAISTPLAMESEQENRRGILQLAYVAVRIGAFPAGSVSGQASNGKCRLYSFRFKQTTTYDSFLLHTQFEKRNRYNAIRVRIMFRGVIVAGDIGSVGTD